MSFSDPPQPPPFMLPNFPSGNIAGFWPQIALNNEEMDSRPQFDYEPSSKRQRNSGNNPSDPSPFAPMTPKMKPSNPPINKTGHIFYKTRMCLKFLDGNCRNGENCTFAHGAEDLREPPPNWKEIVAKDNKVTGNWNDDERIVQRMKICKKYYNGEECPYGERCNFLHEPRFRPEMGSPRESSAISIGTTGPLMGNNNAYYLPEVNNKHVNSSFDLGRGYTKPAYWKTKLCSKWEIMGHCPFGERCHFAHGLSELQEGLGRVEAEAVNTVCIPPNPVYVPANDAPPSKTVVDSAPVKQDGMVKKCFLKWKGEKKINRIYADWIDDDPIPPCSLPSQAES